MPKFVFYRIENIVGKGFADDNSNVTKMPKFVFYRIEDIVGKEENAGYQHFLLFSKYFPNAFPVDADQIIFYATFSWLPGFSPFPKIFSKGFYLRVVKSRDCVVKG